jgi:hypothetical protein
VHYKVHGHILHTEQTAKPRKQASKVLKRWILLNNAQGNVADYGCGRLRYATELAKVAKSLTLVDSKEQLFRTQRLDGKPQSIFLYAAKKWKNARALTVEDFERDKRRYDFILCSNVLPVVPCPRQRLGILKRIRKKLKLDGRCLLVAQYRNSYYRELQNDPRASCHLDGLLVARGVTSTFFGLMPKNTLINLAERCGLFVHKAWVEGESAYVLCMLRGPNKEKTRLSAEKRV